MRDKGVYIQFWRKYIPVIRLLLKKVAAGEPQKLQLYKHEFEKTGAKNKLGYIFNLEVVKGKPVNKTDKMAVASDLLSVMNENEAVYGMLRETNFKITVGRSCEMNLQKYVVEEKAPIVLETSAAV